MSQLYGNSDDLSTLELKSAAYYAIIPASVRYHQQLSANAKLLYGEGIASPATNTLQTCTR